MSMTREEAIKTIEFAKTYISKDGMIRQAIDIALSALRPVSRERVEGIRGEWMFPIFGDQEDPNDPRYQCSECGSIETPLVRHRFCPSCGAPMTDEAEEIVVERLEALHESP